MFYPTIYIRGVHNLKLVEQESIRETFGDDKLSKDMLKYYTKMNIHHFMNNGPTATHTYNPWMVLLATPSKPHSGPCIATNRVPTLMFHVVGALVATASARPMTAKCISMPAGTIVAPLRLLTRCSWNGLSATKSSSPYRVSES
jgi:hypothetical protein